MAGSQGHDQAKQKQEEDAMEAKERELVNAIAPSVFLSVISGAMLLSARQAVLMKHFATAADTSIYLGKLASIGAFFEFLINPIFGKLADAYGRRPIMPIGNAAVAVTRVFVLLLPEMKFPHFVDSAITIPLVTSFFTTYRAMLADHLEGSAFARANAKISMGAGAAIVLGPLITKAVMNRRDPKFCFLLSVCFASVSVLNIFFNVKESLPEEKRMPLVLKDMQPFGFLQLLKSNVLNRLMLTTGMQTFTEGRNVQDIYVSYLMNDLKWSWSQINTFISAFGSSLIVSGLTVKSLLKTFGLINFTTFSNMCNILFYLFFIRFPPLNFFPVTLSAYLGVLFAAPGGRKRDAAESLIMRIGNQAGFGNGFISGCMNNYRALINVIGPVMFGSLYAWGSKRKLSGLPFLVGILTILASEASLRSLSKDELGLDENGQVKDTASSTTKSSQVK
mmetsp:Transcript_74435/g.166995  ORF Transcript_74435/g.166995 Transcript_74435/m.166995 type:complete len:449 (+) Transcript_74435:111-1457(+)